MASVLLFGPRRLYWSSLLAWNPADVIGFRSGAEQPYRRQHHGSCFRIEPFFNWWIGVEMGFPKVR